MADDGPTSPLRVWVSGCATGEEAYSVAIALTEFLQGDIRTPACRFSRPTSARPRSSSPAPASIRPASPSDVSPERLRAFFTRTDGGYRISKSIRDLCVFARQDLTRDPPFSRLDLILCRNVLIYMDTVLQKKLLSVFHYALNAGRLPDARAGRERRRAGDAVHAARQEAAHPPQEGRPADSRDAAVPDRARRRRRCRASRRRRRSTRAESGKGPAGRGRAAPILERYAPPGVVDRQRVPDRAVPRPDRRLPRAGAGRGEPEPAEDGARRAALRLAQRRSRRRASSGRPVRKTGLHVQGGRRLDAGDPRRRAADGRRPAALPGAVRRARGRTASRRLLPPESAPAKEEAASAAARCRCCNGSSRPAASTCSRSSRSWRRPTRSCSRPTRRSCRATRSCRAPTRSSTPRRRSCSRPTRS